MKYSLGIVWCTVLAGCVFSLCDVPIVVSVESSSFSSLYAQALQYTMRVWSDIRVAAYTLHTLHNQDDYNTFVYAILGQLLCVDNAMTACDSTILLDDVAYLMRVLEMVKQEANALPLISVQAQLMQQLFENIEKKISALLCQSDDTSISTR